MKLEGSLQRRVEIRKENSINRMNTRLTSNIYCYMIIHRGEYRLCNEGDRKENGDSDERANTESLVLRMSRLSSYVASGARARKFNFTKRWPWCMIWQSR